MNTPVLGATLFGDSAHLVNVETRLGRGLSRVVMVGMPDAVAREARERLPAALAHHGFNFPKGKVLFNLVPAQLPKRGLPLDLALAVSLLIQDRQLPCPQEPILFLAELDLQGGLRAPARATLLASLAALEHHCHTVVTAVDSAKEAAIAPSIQVFGLEDLAEVERFLRRPQEFEATPAVTAASTPADPPRTLRLDDVRGQMVARRAALLAIAGRHSLLLQGPPGTGKSMLARRLAAKLPALNAAAALELARVEALLGPVPEMPRNAPFRAPHTSASQQAVLGGGMPLRPGEIARAHGGVLFLDELPEFSRPVLEGLRQPLEEKEVRLQRAREWATYPADVMLVATSNPCPCGYATHPKVPCRCTPTRLDSYRNRISGPLQDRFDLFVEMGPVSAIDLQQPPSPPHDEEVLKLLQDCRNFQVEQSQHRRFTYSRSAELDDLQAAGVETDANTLLRQAISVVPLSGRGVLRCLRVARTSADLDCRQSVNKLDLSAALSLRPLASKPATATTPPRSPGPATQHQQPASERQARASPE